MMPARASRSRLVLAAVLVVAITASAMVLIRHRAPLPGKAARPAPLTAPSPAASGTALPSAPAPDAPSDPRVSLAGLRWADFYGVMLPVSPVAGPRDTRSGLASGYSDTPPGAVLAAVNIAVRATPQFGPRIFRPTIDGQVTGPDASALLQSCAAAYSQAVRAAHVKYGQPLGLAYVVEQGFRLVSWSPAQATVDIVSAGPGPQGVTARAATRVGLEWLRGDWRVVAPPGGNWAASATEMSSLAGFTYFPLPSGG